ncbi:MAG TPA: ATPase [Mycobacterium sp.]
MSNDEHWVATRAITATPAEIFAVLSDPAKHQDTEPTDWVRDAIDTEQITGTGQIFAMNMFLERIGGPYVMHNLVTVFEQDRAIGWSPGSIDADGNHRPGGWWWRYDLAPSGTSTEVTLTYDWSGTPQKFRDEVGTPPPFERQFLDDSLDTLDRAVTQ